MTELFSAFLRILLTLAALTSGLIVAASVLAAFALMLGLWGLRAGWARLMGRPATPFMMGLNPLSAFSAVFRHARSTGRGQPQPQPDSPRAPGPRLHRSGVTDVEARAPLGD